MKNGARSLLLLLGDIVALWVAFFIMLEIAFPNSASEKIINSHLWPFLFVFGIWLFVFFLFNLYEPESVKPTIPNLKKIGVASMVALAASTIMFYVIPSFGITPKTNLVIFSAIFVFFFLGWRRIFYNIFSTYFRKKVAFIINEKEDGEEVKEVANYIKNYPQSGFLVSGVYSSPQDFFEKRDREEVDTLIVSKNALTGTENIKLLCNTTENILDLTYAYEDILGRVSSSFVDEVWFLYNTRKKSNVFYETIIYFINIIFILIALAILSPFLLIIALLIKWEDKGPIFYTQTRVGKNGKIFKFYKFRSMVVDADKNGAEWTEKNDSRITRVGKVIRRLHLDEIPQLWNILKRDMALVGPRPELLSFESKLEKEIPHYNLRHIIAPGFTGWAQIKFRNARGIAESKEKFEYDLYYIKNRNIFMDFGIILRTIVIIFTHD